MKRLNTIIGTLLAVSVITGCSSRIQQPLMDPDFNSLDVSNTSLVSPKTDFHKQDISIKMDQYYPAPQLGMKWTYELERVFHNITQNQQVEISIADINNKYVYVSVSGQTMRFARATFWYEFNLYLTRVFHNKNFAEYPGYAIDDQYAIFRSCSSPDSCGGYEVEVPAGKFIVESLLIQDIGATSDDPDNPNQGQNNLNWDTSHFWVDGKTGLIQMKLETPSQPNLGTTTLTLEKTNIK
jgi:hypothetical protein